MTKLNYLMTSVFYLALILQSPIVAAAAQSQESAGSKSNQQSLLDRWNELLDKARQEAGLIKNLGEPRKVPKGAQPELILRKNEIFFNQNKLSLGESIETWKEKIPAKPRCFEGGMTHCLWDDYGLEVGTGSKNDNKVVFIHIHISIDKSYERPGRADYPDGRPAKPQKDNVPHHPFSGYLELNGVGIDAETEFWEIPAGSIDNNQLKCGLSDCSHPGGPFSEHANIYLRLDGMSEHGRLRTLQIGSAD